MKVRKSLRKWRTKNNITQKEIAETIGTTQQQYQLYETKRDIPANKIREIAKEYNVSADELLGLEKKEEN